MSQTRLIDSESNINRDWLRRYVLKRWLATGRQSTLVICQQDYEQWLSNQNLPSEIVVEHYNNIAGLDRYREVRLLILIGRVQPGPEAVEIYAGALTGAQPIKAPASANGGTWYRKVRRGIRLPDGSGIAVDCDEHPDPMAEMVRFQLCEAEMIQAIGRARGINRTADNPVDVDIVADVCLPITVNEVSLWWWTKPTPLIETAALDGVVLTSPVDLTRCWPALWPNTRAADRMLVQLKRERPLMEMRQLLKGWRAVTYQPTGNGQRQRVGYFDHMMIADPKTWLEAKIGPLRSYAEDGGDFEP